MVTVDDFVIKKLSVWKRQTIRFYIYHKFLQIDLDHLSPIGRWLPPTTYEGTFPSDSHHSGSYLAHGQDPVRLEKV